ncbi:unnamed protein product [Parascedosporium putredinis]|uniref:Pkr1-domain-containing protein n=1 Tax=Parascedosporium putredinis TaxID=1442378 RepID=A0A9P1H695_9PEZI|nr:unnamed protein product [Parascedosporium putredinis]CAI7998514.1 unnamed protein product [Parascedosporium putredinis]
MTSFLEDLWESIFVAGPTPTLLKAANGTFAALQILLAVLLVTTNSMHFVALSVLCGGLWWSINWFATELRIHQEREEREKRKAEAEAARDDAAGGSSGDDDDDGQSDSETEVETSMTAPPAALKATTATTTTPTTAAAAEATVPSAETRSAQVLENVGEMRKRETAASVAARGFGPGMHSSVSTEDEWEKVSESENDKRE